MEVTFVHCVGLILFVILLYLISYRETLAIAFYHMLNLSSLSALAELPLVAEPLASDRIFSFARCRRNSNFLDRICYLENVCWNNSGRTWVFFENPASTPLMLATKDGTIPLRKVIPLVQLRREEQDFPFSLSFEAGPIPNSSVMLKQKVHILFEMFWAENYGHALCDDILPAYSLMREFNLVTRDVQIMTPADCCSRLPEDETARGRKFLNFFTSLISDYKLLDLSQSFPKLSSDYICVSKLLVGHGRMGLAFDQGRAWPDFIKTCIQSAASKWRNVREAVSMPITKQKIIVLQKHGRRRLLNHNELVRDLRNTFNVDVDSVDPSKLPLPEQVALAQRATVIISPCGGISFFSAFLRKHTSTVFIGYWDTGSNSSRNMEEPFWKWLPHLTDLYYDVRLEEVTILSPGNRTARNFIDYRNYGSTTVNLNRMRSLIASALFSSEHNLKLAPHSFRN